MPDNIESRMNFIIEQQAQFVTDIHLLKEDIGLLKDRQADTMRMVGQLVDVSMSLAHHGEETDRRLRELTEAGARTDQRLRELAESGAHTDRRLDALIDVVDKATRRKGR